MDVGALEQTLPELSANEARLVGLALHLYQGYSTVEMTALAKNLDHPYWFVVSEALERYCRGFAGG